MRNALFTVVDHRPSCQSADVDRLLAHFEALHAQHAPQVPADTTDLADLLSPGSAAIDCDNCGALGVEMQTCVNSACGRLVTSRRLRPRTERDAALAVGQPDDDRVEAARLEADLARKQSACFVIVSALRRRAIRVAAACCSDFQKADADKYEAQAALVAVSDAVAAAEQSLEDALAERSLAARVADRAQEEYETARFKLDDAERDRCSFMRLLAKAVSLARPSSLDAASACLPCAGAACACDHGAAQQPFAPPWGSACGARDLFPERTGVSAPPEDDDAAAALQLQEDLAADTSFANALQRTDDDEAHALQLQQVGDDEDCALQLEDNEKLVAEEARLAREAEDHRVALEMADTALSEGRISPPKTKKPKTKVCTVTKPRFTSKLGARVGLVNGHLVFEKVTPFNLAHSFGLRDGMIIVSVNDQVFEDPGELVRFFNSLSGGVKISFKVALSSNGKP